MMGRPQTSLGNRVLSLAAVGAAVAVIWLLILPPLGEIPSVRERIERNRNAGINPTAVFYTDHPAMPEIERRIELDVNSSSGSFWKMGTTNDAEDLHAGERP